MATAAKSQPGIEDELRLVLVGLDGSGKSATGNSILGSNVFNEHIGGSSTETSCCYGRKTYGKRSILVIDTPQMFVKEFNREVAKCLLLCAPGPHAILLVVRANRLSESLKYAAGMIEDVFGTGAKGHIFVIVTGEDDMAHEGITLEQFRQQVPSYVQELFTDYPVFALNNRASEQERREKAEQLVETICQKIKKKTTSDYLSNDMFNEIEALFHKIESENQV